MSWLYITDAGITSFLIENAILSNVKCLTYILQPDPNAIEECQISGYVPDKVSHPIKHAYTDKAQE